MYRKTRVFGASIILISGLCAFGTLENQDFSKVLRGRFILDQAKCAGFEFLGNKQIVWRNEITCQQPDTFLIHWVDAKSFLMKDKKSPTGKKDCPPRNWFYTVEKFDGKKLQIRELWTGWGDYKSELLSLSKI